MGRDGGVLEPMDLESWVSQGGVHDMSNRNPIP